VQLGQIHLCRAVRSLTDFKNNRESSSESKSKGLFKSPNLAVIPLSRQILKLESYASPRQKFQKDILE
jgi:hypothetical protein